MGETHEAKGLGNAKLDHAPAQRPFSVPAKDASLGARVEGLQVAMQLNVLPCRFPHAYCIGLLAAPCTHPGTPLHWAQLLTAGSPRCTLAALTSDKHQAQLIHATMLTCRQECSSPSASP